MSSPLDLVLERVVDIRPELVWVAWTEPKHIVNWFTPKPWQTIAAEVDLRPGGKFNSTFKSPDGQIIQNYGCFLEVVPRKRLVFTDCLREGWRPSGQSFLTAIVEITPEGTGTRYKATALHASEADAKKHLEMGFINGWGTALDQLVAYMKSL
jgi:uncharacterized protein YndB with AHSA1/START domain